MASTLYEKLWQRHVIEEKADETPLIYVDRHLIHEVTSPQAFANLKFHNRVLRHPERTIATMDHNISTRSIEINAAGEGAANQLRTLEKNCKEFGIELFGMGHKNQGIVHVMGPELGLTLPVRLLFVVTPTQQHMAPLVPWLLVLAPLRLNTYLPHKPYVKPKQKP